jgi:hypothetical protein
VTAARPLLAGGLRPDGAAMLLPNSRSLVGELKLITATPRRQPLHLGLPDDQPILVFGADVKGERSESVGREAPLTSASNTK